MTRSPEKAKRIRSDNIGVIQGDFRDRESLKKALDGMYGAFVMGTPYEKGPKAEVTEGKAMIDACAEEGISHVVYSSVCCADKQTGIPHFDSRNTIEKHLKKSGLPYTILRPVWFMENFASPWYRPSIEKGIVSSPLHPKRPLQMVSVADTGAVRERGPRHLPCWHALPVEDYKGRPEALPVRLIPPARDGGRTPLS
jgi:uncharacterized protein YbjT (DUF2867 family)